MNHKNFCRGTTLALTLTMALSHLPAAAFAAEGDGLCDHHTAHTAQCGFEEKGECSFLKEGCPDCDTIVELTPILGTDVLIDGTSFPYTGEEIRPAITVTVGGTELTEKEHYTLTYENNIEPGTATVTVRGIATAGYDGTILIDYTIEEAPAETQPEETRPGENQPEESKPEETQPEETKPEETQPEETKPEETQPEETQPVEYEITRGSGSKWYQGSGKHLFFTVSHKDVTGISVNGKALSKSDYATSGTSVRLNSGYLSKLAVGTYNIDIHFADGDAEGTFTVSDQLDATNPVTGETSRMDLWITVCAAALAGLAGAFFLQRKVRK